MFTNRQLNALAERRKLLVLEGELHRSLVVLERENLRARLAGLRAAREQVASHKPLLLAGSAVAGLFALRHWRKLARWMPAALTALRWVQSWKGNK